MPCGIFFCAVYFRYEFLKIAGFHILSHHDMELDKELCTCIIILRWIESCNAAWLDNSLVKARYKHTFICNKCLISVLSYCTKISLINFFQFFSFNVAFMQEVFISPLCLSIPLHPQSTASIYFHLCLPHIHFYVHRIIYYINPTSKWFYFVDFVRYGMFKHILV